MLTDKCMGVLECTLCSNAIVCVQHRNFGKLFAE